MTRHALRGPVLLGLLTALAVSTARAQPPSDVVTVRDRKDNTIKAHSGQYAVTPAGFQVLNADKKAVATFHPDDVVKVAIGELAGADRSDVLSAAAKEDKKDYAGAAKGYKELLDKAAAAPERTRRYLEYKMIANNNRVVDETEPEKWKAGAEDVVKQWRGFIQNTPLGWELWSAARASTRVNVELGKFDDAATSWGRLAAAKDLPAEAKLDAQLQQVDLLIRGKKYGDAATIVGELLKAGTAQGARKDRLAIYEIAAKSGPLKPLDAVAAIKAEMDKSKEPAAHATGYSMIGEMHLADGTKPREAMYSFLWVETVLNQDRDEVFKAMVRLTAMFETGSLADEDQAKKYHDKLRRARGVF